jgi:hypothetical protein
VQKRQAALGFEAWSGGITFCGQNQNHLP